MEESAKYNRRQFTSTLLKAGLIGLTGLHLPDILRAGDFEKLTLLHTNDTHSRIDPFPASDPSYPGCGGVRLRASCIDAIREAEKHVLLLDSGDIFQGTPYFNYFGGEVEFKAMSAMGYDAATMGNHDFDNGIDGLVKQLPHATFPFINCNYRLDDTALAGHVLPYKVFVRGPFRIGVFGVGIKLDGLLPAANFKGLHYEDPVTAADKTAKLLRKKEDCNLVVCLSHLGYRYDDKSKASDEMLACATRGIDAILGGHTHTFLEKPILYKNSENKKVLIAQTGWGGINLGRIDFIFPEKHKDFFLSSSTIKISEKTRQKNFFLKSF